MQGCYRELCGLLDYIEFDSKHDRLGFVGDLVNRGPQSLETLRFIKSLDEPLVVLGNHDVYLVFEAYGYVDSLSSNTISDILNAPDKIELIEWLRHLPFMIKHDFGAIVHAGIPPQWTIEQAFEYAAALSDAFKADDNPSFLSELEGVRPDYWNEQLSGSDRYRYILNAFTRMRFVSASGQLDLQSKGNQSINSRVYRPWYDFRLDDDTIFFGHWATLQGVCPRQHIYALDTGCVYGNKLTAIRLEDKKLFHYSAQ